MVQYLRLVSTPGPSTAVPCSFRGFGPKAARGSLNTKMEESSIMRKFTTKDLTLAALVAALYAVLGYFGNIFGLTFGVVQIRFAEALTVLPFLFPATAPGLALGCLITNLLSPYGPLDMVLGTLATAIAAFLTARMPRWYLAALPPVLVNMVILAPMWSWAEVGAVNSAFWAACGFNAATFAVGEVAACYVLGTVLLLALPKVRYFRTMIPERRLAQF